MTHGGGRQGRAGRPSPAEQGGLQSRPDRGLRAHPGTPEQAWIPDTPEVLTPEKLRELLVGHSFQWEGQGFPCRALHWGTVQQQNKRVLRPRPLDPAASPTHSGEKGPRASTCRPEPCLQVPPVEQLDRQSPPPRQPQGGRWVSHHL